MLDADIRLRLDRLNLDAVLSVQAGEVVALLGPNGAGKSTVLRALAGLLRLDGGKVELDGTVLEEPARHTRVAPEKRPIGLMFQDYLLFPHLSAVENVAFGLRARGVDKRVARERAAAALERLGVAKVAEARPGNMSGGQQQRVAMARAMVTEPKLLLLDEPLAALDVSTKTDVRRQLRATLRESQAANVMVTHDLLDAVALADRMFVIEDGGIAQSGTPAEVTARPKSRYVADLVGVNLLRGTARGTDLDLDGGGRLVIAGEISGQVLAVIAPHDVSVSRDRPEQAGSPANVWPGQIGAVDLMGDRVRVRVDGTPTITAEVTPAAVDALNLDSGGQLWASVPSAAIRSYPP
jgi:molybdate transport system ATP-binding protein